MNFGEYETRPRLEYHKTKDNDGKPVYVITNRGAMVGIAYTLARAEAWCKWNCEPLVIAGG